jgi:hypothetical protein
VLTLQAQGAAIISRVEEYTANDRFDELRFIEFGRKRGGSMAYHTEREMQELSNAAHLMRVRSEHLGWPMDPPGGFSMPPEQWEKWRQAEEKRDRRMARLSGGDRTGFTGAMCFGTDLAPAESAEGGGGGGAAESDAEEDSFSESSESEEQR